MSDFFKSKTFTAVLFSIGAIVLALAVFQLGMFVGFRKAAFSFRWGEDYYRTFGGGRKPMEMGMKRDGLFDSHGATGKIIKITLPNIFVEGPDMAEKSVLVGDKTEIRRFRDELGPSDLKVGDFVVIIGVPNSDSEIEARLIRLLPPPPEFFPDAGMKIK